MVQKIKKIWNVIAGPLWIVFAISLCLFSAWCSWKHAKNDNAQDIEMTKTTMNIGALLVENILQRPGYESINKKQLDSIYKIESEKIIKNIYNKK